MTRLFSIMAALLAAASLSSTAGAVSAASDKPPAVNAAGLQTATYQPPPTITERIAGLKIVLTQVNYPGVPERSACRFLVRAINESDQRLGAHALLRTFDTYQSSLNAWLVPTGDLAPGQSVERIYSCKMAQSIILDQGTAGGWPGRCTVNGEERSPCPATLVIESNLPLLKEDPTVAANKTK